jgi:hypothetical protein
MIRFIEVVNKTNFNPRLERTAKPRFSLEELWINEKYVVSIREATGHKKLLLDGLLPSDLAEGHMFTAITTNQGTTTETHVVVGDPVSVAERIKPHQAGLLKG